MCFVVIVHFTMWAVNKYLRRSVRLLFIQKSPQPLSESKYTIQKLHYLSSPQKATDNACFLKLSHFQKTRKDLQSIDY